MHCYFHPHATLERIAQDIHFTNVDGDKLETRVMLRCTCMLSDKLRCPFVCAEYDSERKQERKCYSCGGSLRDDSDNSVLTTTRCADCKHRDQKNYRARRKIMSHVRAAKRSGKHALLLAP
jgi:hypothetical protein